MSQSQKRSPRYRPEENPPVVRRALGGFVGGLLVVLDVLLGAYMATTKLFPAKYLLVIYAALALVTLVVILLLMRPKRIFRFSCGVLLGAVMIAGLLYAGHALVTGVQTLGNITEVRTEIAHIGVYVNTADEAEDLQTVSSDPFGILADRDRESVDKSLEQLEDMLEKTITVHEFATPAELVEALYAGDVRAIVLNDAYFGLLKEMEGYADIEDRVRELTTVQVETKVGVVVTPPTQTEEEEVPENENVFTVYISGVDSRHGLNVASRSDVNILATVNTKTKQVLLISTPRDYYVPLSISNGAPDKLTHAGIYGVNVSMDTIGMIYGIPVDYYFRVNFEGFRDIVNSLGGIVVNSERYFTAGGYTFYSGENYMDGNAALVFARERYAFADGDFQRGRNQMAVIRAVINKALSPEILVNYAALLSAAEGCFETSVPYDLIATVVRDQLDKGGEWNIVSYSAAGTVDSQIPWSMSQYASVVIPDEASIATAKAMIEQVYNDEVVTQP